MVLKPPILLPSTPPQLVNYSFIDVATGTGYATYFAGTASGANVLSPNVFNSNSVNTNAAVLNNTYVKYIDVDFDVLFNLPQDIRGNAIVDVPLGFEARDASLGGHYSYIVAKLIKLDTDRTTELEEIGEGSSPEWIVGAGWGGAGAFKFNIRSARIVVPHTHYKRGESLRLTVEVWAKDTASANNKQVIMGHDPANRSSLDGEAYNSCFASGASILKLQLPLRIDL